MAKEKKESKLLITVGIPVLLTLTVLVGVFVISKRQPKLVNQVTETPGTLTEKVDKDDDGMYINYKYGYKFEYPSDKFELLDPNAVNPSRVWIYQSGDEYIKLSVSIGNDNFLQFYKDLYELEINKNMQYRHGTSTKLADGSSDNYKQVVFSSDTNPGAEIEPSISYSSVWLKEDSSIITLNFFTGSYNFLNENRYIFDQIVKSFEFTNQ